MKNRNQSQFLSSLGGNFLTIISVAGLGLGFTAPSAFAADLTWDTSTDPEIQAGTGSWDTAGAPNWTSDGGTTNVDWSQASTTDATNAAIFAGADDLVNPYVVTLASQMAVESLTFNNTGYSVTGSTLYLESPTITVATGKSATIESILDGGALTKEGAGLLILSGASANTYTGLTTVTAGGLRVSKAGALGTTAAGTVVNGSSTFGAGNARLELAGGVTVTGEALTINGAGNASATGALTSTTGSNVWAGNVTIGSASTRIGASNLASLTISGVIDSGLTTTGLTIRSDQATASAVGGTVILSGANTYLGDTSFGHGTLKLDGGNNRLPVTTKLTIGVTGSTTFVEFDLNGRSQELAGLVSTGSSTTTVNNSSLTPATLTVNTEAASTSYTKLLKGNLALQKTGANTLTLGGANTYSGATTVSSGTLTLGLAPDPLNANTGNDASTVMIAATDATLNLTYVGTDVVNKLFIGDTQQAAGEYGKEGSDSPIIGIPQITGDGTLTVTASPGGSNFASWANDPGKGNIPGELPGGDFDNDGITNIVEYALGMDPRVSSQPAGVFSGNTITYTKGADAIANGDVSWVIETSQTLLGGSWIPVVSQPAGNDSPTISHTFTPGTPVKNFARLKVTQTL